MQRETKRKKYNKINSQEVVGAVYFVVEEIIRQLQKHPVIL